MKGLYDFIVEVEDRYNNKVDVDGQELIVNTEISERDHIFVNRVGKVIGVPTIGEYGIKEGDDVLVHHNVFRRWYDMRGKEKNGRSFLFGNTYTVQPEQIFGYWNGGQFRSVPGYTFLRPLSNEEKWDTSRELATRGLVEYSDIFEKGRTLGFKPDMNVEFNIDNTKLYRILNKFITVDYGFQEQNKTIN